MSIRQLPDHVADRIKSSVAITSLTGAVCGLLKNALDASATKVNVHVDFAKGNCTVEDNGVGIPPDEFKAGGRLGELHSTTKFPPSVNIHGRQGDFLASLKSLSFLSVTSHHYRHISHSTLVAHNGNVLERQLPSRPEQRFEIFDNGTRAMVRDLFGSMPVRVKHRAAQFASTAAIHKEMQRLLLSTAALLLAWPFAVSISLIEATTGRETRLKSVEGDDTVARTSKLLAQASLLNSNHAASWMPVSASSGQITVKGCISIDPVPTRQAQFLSVGIHPVSNDHGANILYDEINKMFSNSSFGRLDDEYDIASRGGINGSEATLRLRKGLDRWPMFYLQIRIEELDDKNLADHLQSGSERNLTAILELLKALCHGFLRKQRLRPQNFKLAAGDSSLSTETHVGRSRKTPKASSSNASNASSRRAESRNSLAGPKRATLESPFDGWNRIKVGFPSISSWSKATQQSAGFADRPPSPHVKKDGRQLREPFESLSPSSAQDTKDEAPKLGSVEPQNFPDFGRRLSKSDNALSEQPANIQSDRSTPALQNRALERRPKTDVAGSQPASNMLASWKNPVFEATQPVIRQLHPDDVLSSCKTAKTANEKIVGGISFESGSLSLKGRISQAALAEAEVISQVDRKFILLKLPLRNPAVAAQNGDSSALTVIDQHAADERCRLEDLMAAYFEPNPTNGCLTAVVEPLELPILFHVSVTEGQLFKRYQTHLEAWGIHFCQSSASSSDDTDGTPVCRVKIMGLPPSILERCRSEPRLLVELMRKEVWALEDGSAMTSQPSLTSCETESGPMATFRFHSCPRGILELLHSRACRSAIMFNDELSRTDCVNLIQRLAKCAFPFQCAHGRPSMVPLVDLGRSSGRDASTNMRGDGQRSGIEKWMNYWTGAKLPS